MNQKETATIRQALRLIATGETLDARRMLAQLTLASAPKSVRPAAKTNQKRAHGFKGHPFGCQCSASCQRYASDWRAAVMFPLVQTEETSFDAIQASKELSADSESIAAEGYRLTLCECGHSADKHLKDELENLLECHATDGMIGDEYRKPCDCDHFHYQADDEPISAAAGA